MPISATDPEAAGETLLRFAGSGVERLVAVPGPACTALAVPGSGGKPFLVASLGADGREGGSGNDADITN